jgi:hypothetical protein
MFELLQLHAERFIELGDRSRKNQGSPSFMFLDNREAVIVRELLYRCDIAGVGSVVLRKISAPEMAVRFMTRYEFPDARFQRIVVATTQKYGDFQALRRIRLSYGLRSRQWCPLAAFKWIP